MDSSERRLRCLEAVARRSCAKNQPVSVAEPLSTIVDLDMPSAEPTALGLEESEVGQASLCVNVEALPAEAEPAAAAVAELKVDQAPLTVNMAAGRVTTFRAATNVPVNMLCVSAEDLYLIIQKVHSNFQSASTQHSKCTITELPSVEETVRTQPEVPSFTNADVLVMDSSTSNVTSNRSRSPLPDISWMFDTTPAPVVKTVPASPSKSRSPSPDVSFMGYTSTLDSRKRTRNVSEEAETKYSSSAAADWPLSDGASRDLNHQFRSPPRNRKISSEGAATKSHFSKSSLLDSNLVTSESRRKCSSSRKPLSRSPSPDISFLNRPSTSRDSKSCSSSQKPRSRSTSPDFSFLNRPSTSRDTQKSCRLSRRTKPRSPSPDWSFLDTPSRDSNQRKPRSRSPSPNYSFMDQPSTSRGPRERPCAQSRLCLRSLPLNSKSESALLPVSRQLSPNENRYDPDYSPFPIFHVKSKAPPKKRGRPPKPKPVGGPVCSVCKEDARGKLTNTECGHFFHDQCLRGWLDTEGQRNRTLKVCPNCGMDFDIENNNPIYL